MKKNINVGETVIKVNHVSKSFKLYFDKGRSLKEKVLFWKRNRHEIREVLNDISFEVKKGESVGLIGRNGCGKSTLLKMLTKIYYPNKGSIEIEGRVSSLIELGAGFHPDMTGRENIYINASIFGLTKEEIDSRLKDIIEFSELGNFIDNPIRTYSSGMYMRLAFAVAINVDADILLIDEILAVGDANFQSKCFNKLKELQSQGITIVLVTHSMKSIIDFCDKCIWIEKGQIKDKGPTNEVTNHYVEYMNDEQMMKTLNEQDRMAVKNEIARKNQIQEAISIDNKRKKGLDDTMDHYGIKQDIIKKISLLNSKKQLVSSIQNDQPVVINIEINKLSKKYKNLNIVWGINSKFGKTHFFDTKINNIKFIDNDSIKIYIKNLPLNNGDYNIMIGFFDDVIPLDVYNKAIDFKIANAYNSNGLVSISYLQK